MNWLSLSGMNKYSTMIGRVWLSMVYIFRVLLFVAVVQPLWEDISKDFVCNTLDTECSRMCYDHTFPISHICLWALQLILINCPSLMVMSHVMFHKQKNQYHTTIQDGKHLYANPGKKHGGLWIYLLTLICTAAIDAVFLYILYNKGFDLPILIKCSVDQCPNMVDCYLSHTIEKKIITIFMVASSALCILMCIIEMIYLVCKHRNKVQHKRTEKEHMRFAEQPELRALSQLRCECEVITIASA